MCRVEVRSRLSVCNRIAQHLIARTIRASRRACASQGFQLSLEVLLDFLKTRQSLLIIIGALIQALNEDILEEDVILEFLARSHGERVAGVCIRRCSATECDFVFGGGHSEAIVCRAWQWCAQSDRVAGAKCRDITGAGRTAARINCLVSCGADAVNVARGCNKALWWPPGVGIW